jgi:uncharacterized protein (TIGR02147 family)
LNLVTTQVFSHTSYRSFLKTYAEEKRREHANWSYGSWAKKLKLKGTASLTMVINGQRRPGPKMARALADYFRFSERERQYFLDLIQLEKIGDNARIKVLVMEQLRKLSPGREFKLLDDKTFSAIAGWHFYAIRQICRTAAVVKNAEDISARLLFPVGVRKIREAVTTLLELGLLSRSSETGALSCTEKSVTSSDDLRSEALKQFHEGVLSISTQAVRKFDVSERELRAATFSVEAKDFSAMQKKIRVFMSELLDEYGREGGDSVYQMAIQLFPLAKCEADSQNKDGGDQNGI